MFSQYMIGNNYRPIRLGEDVYWHIGGHGKSITEAALKELTKVLI